MLEKRLKEWMEKVLAAYNDDRPNVGIDTYRMVVDVDKIISEEFDHDPVLHENL